jgi:hypothetical protein
VIPRAYPVEPLSQWTVTPLSVGAQGTENVLDLVCGGAASEVRRE